MRRSPPLIYLLIGCLLAVARPARAADPTTADCLNAVEMSLALRNQHRLREARAQLLVCSAASCPADVREECIRRVEMVNAAIPTVVFEAKDATNNDLSAVRVTIDGQPLVERLEGTALSIDPGEHVFVFETAGQPTVQKRLVIHEGEKGRRERISFSAVPEVVIATSTTPPPPEPGLGTQRILALAAAGAGVVSLGIGIGFGIRAMSKHDEANRACPGDCSDQQGVELWDQAVTAGNVSTAAIIIGTAALAGGAALWLTGKPSANGAGDGPRAQVGCGLGSLQLRGTW